MEKRCGAQTLRGGTCKHKVQGETQHCWIHQGPQCSVCFGPLAAQGNRTLGCGHSFHTRCVDRWKRTCPGDPTCPLCRVPFDLPVYKCRLIIERVFDNQRTVSDFETSNVANIIAGFGLDFRELIPRGTGRLLTDIHFDVDPTEVLEDILRELGLPDVRFD